MSTKLDPVPYTNVTLADHKRFDASAWLQDEAEADPAIRSELLRIRQAEDETIGALTKEVPEIDWEHWEETIDAPGLVAKLRKAYDEVPVPDMEEERQRLHKEIHDAFEPLLAKIKQHALDAEAQEKVYRKRLEEVSYLHDNINDIPLDEFLAKYPAVKKKLEDDIIENKWFV